MANMFELRWSILAAACVGMLLAPLGQTWWRGVTSYYDDARPVLRMTATVTSVTSDSVVLHLTGEKLRSCRYIRMQAFVRLVDGVLDDIGLLRVDQDEIGSSKPVGKHDFGQWKVWPIKGSRKLVIYAQHDCGDRLVTSKAVEMDIVGGLPQSP